MFEDLYDEISLLWSRFWPVADGIVTEVISERLGHDQQRIRLAVAYEFSVGEDGPYTGESFWTPAFCQLRRVANARKRIRKGQKIRIRYRPRQHPRRRSSPATENHSAQTSRRLAFPVTVTTRIN